MLFARQNTGIQIKTSNELAAMRRAGALASRCLEELIAAAQAGVTTQDLDDLSMEFCKRHGAKPAPLGYRGYPKSICTSINEVICHGIPSKKAILRDGDIICIDVTLIVDGFYGDTAATRGIGQIDETSARLIHATIDSLQAAIDTVRDGSRLGDIGNAVQKIAEPRGFQVVREFVGHGIGRGFHEPPQVSHVGTPGSGVRLRSGMTFTIEPMLNVGTWRAKVLDDEWTAVTVDGQRSAQFEHTIAVTDAGFEILTVQNGTGAWEVPGRCALPELAARS